MPLLAILATAGQGNVDAYAAAGPDTRPASLDCS